MRILLLILLFHTSLIAQEDYTFGSLYRTFEEGQSFYILKDNATIHTAPFVTAATLETLPIGQLVKIEERMDELFRIDGFRTNWYRVSYTNNNVWKEGYIWGGHIAVGAFRSQQSSDILFLYGIGTIELVSRGDYDEESIKLQIAVCRKGLLMDQVQFEAMGTLYTKTQGRALGNRGLRSIRDVVEIAFSDGYCGGVSATATLFWDGAKLHYVQLLSNGFSQANFANKFFIYPRDPEGKSQTVILRDEAGTFGANKQPNYTHQIDKFYIWNGKNLQALE